MARKSAPAPVTVAGHAVPNLRPAADRDTLAAAADRVAESQAAATSAHPDLSAEDAGLAVALAMACDQLAAERDIDDAAERIERCVASLAGGAD